MSRHRSVRGMTYDEEFDGYDEDLYGHSVEDDYGVSPATAEQFMYGGSHRGHQLSSYLENIGEEEDERQDMQQPLADSGSFQKPKLSATDEARLQSCLDEIRSIVGETVPEHVIITKVLDSDFKFETALDAVLNYQEDASHRRKADNPPTVTRNTKGATQRTGHPSHSGVRSYFSHSDVSDGPYVPPNVDSKDIRFMSEHSRNMLLLSDVHSVDSKKHDNSGLVNLSKNYHQQKCRHGSLQMASALKDIGSNQSLSRLAQLNATENLRSGSCLAQLAKEHALQNPPLGLLQSIRESGSDSCKQSLSHLAMTDEKVRHISEGSARRDKLVHPYGQQERVNSEGLIKEPPAVLSSCVLEATSMPHSGLDLAHLAQEHKRQGEGAHKVSGAVSLSLGRLVPVVEKMSVSEGVGNTGAHKINLGKDVNTLSDLAEKHLKVENVNHGTTKQLPTLKPNVREEHNHGVPGSPGSLSLSKLADLHLSKANDSVPMSLGHSGVVGNGTGIQHSKQHNNRDPGPAAITKQSKKKNKTGKMLNINKQSYIISSQGSMSSGHSVDLSPDQELRAHILSPNQELAFLPSQSFSNSVSLLAEPSKFARSICLTYLPSKRKQADTQLSGCGSCKRFRFQRQASLSKYQEVDYKSDITPFDFSTPSPDDVVTQRQKWAFRRTPSETKSHPENG